MGFSHHARPSVPKDIARELGSAGLSCLLQLMVDAYRDLEVRQWVQADTGEDAITEEWLVHILLRWRQRPEMSWVPLQQKQDATRAKSVGKPPAVDFCFRDGLDFRVYFGAECKLLDAGNNTYLKAYLDDEKGIGRFLSGRYASCSGAGAMVGYVRSGSCDEVAASLGMAIQALKGKPRLEKSHLLSVFNQLYESRHSRACPVAEFLCYHLLFGFNCGALASNPTPQSRHT
jgi:hypothetical protein